MTDTTYQITVESDGEPFPCPQGERVLIAMERVGRKAIPVGCRGGGCGACRVRVRAGLYTTGRMSRDHVSAADKDRGYALACRLYPEGDLILELAGKTAGKRKSNGAG